jgi:hypothetical protein
MMSRLLTVDVYHFNPILNGTDPHRLAQVGGWCSTRLLFESFQVCSQLNTVDANFAGWRKLYGARRRVGSKKIGTGRVKHRGGAEETKLVLRAT